MAALNRDELKTEISHVLTNASLESGLVLNSPEAVDWLLSVVAHESLMGTYRKQINGPAIGIYQMEPRTLVDVQRNVLSLPKYERLRKYIQSMPGTIEKNDQKSTLFARAQMLRFPEPFPDVGDRMAQAELWKTRWNTKKGRGTIEKFMLDNERLNPASDAVKDYLAYRNRKNTI